MPTKACHDPRVAPARTHGHPATTTHSERTARQLDAAGVKQGLIRVSVGIEDWRDLLAEYTEALSAIA